MPRPVIGSQRRTHPLIWCLAIICTILTIIVIITGFVVFIGYLVIRPKIPFVSVTSAHLDEFDNDQAGLLSARLTLIFRAENDNHKAHASFSDFEYYLIFKGIKVARLKNWPFEVANKDFKEFTYVVQSDSIPLDPHLMASVDESWKNNSVAFDLTGHTRARWRIGFLGSLRFSLRLNCELIFQQDGRSTDNSHCTSKSR